MIPQENGFIVSSSEPVKNRRKIWLQKGKNLYNPNTMPLMNGLWTGGTSVANNTSGWYVVVPIKGGRTYTVSKKYNNSVDGLVLGRFTTNLYPKEGVPQIDTWESSSTETEMTLKTSNEAKYLFIGLAAGSSLTDDILTKAIGELMVEEKDSKTNYEAYIEPKIYVKNRNENYEEFSNKSSISELVSLPYGISYRKVENDVEFFVESSSLSIPNNLTEIRVLPIKLRPKNTIKVPLCVIGPGGTGISNIRLLIYNDGRVILQNFSTSATSISFMSGHIKYSTL